MSLELEHTLETFFMLMCPDGMECRQDTLTHNKEIAMSNKYSIKDKSFLSASWTLVTAFPRTASVAVDILIDTVDTVTDRVPNTLKKGINTGVDAVEVFFDAAETTEIDMRITYEDWCEEKGVKAFSSREEKIAALRAARASQKKSTSETKIITPSK